MTLVINTDGGSRNNPGESGIGVVICKDGKNIKEISEFLGIQTNNWAEYRAVIRALEEVQKMGLNEEKMEIRLDSKLVVEQLNGNWKVKEPTLKPQYERARELLEDLTDATLVYVPREENKEADALANEAMDRGV